MSRAAWIAASLLVVTNAVWAAIWWSRGTAPETSAASGDAGVDALRHEVDRLRLRAEAAERRAEPSGGALESAGAVPQETVTESPDPEPAVAADEADGRPDAERRREHEAALAQVKASLRKAMQVEDAALRSEGLAEMAAALQGDDPLLVEYTLSGLWSAKDVDLDRAYFAGLVEAHLDSDHPGIRRSSLYAMYAMAPEHADPGLALRSARDEAEVVRHHAGRLIALYTGGALEGEAAQAIVGLLADESLSVRRGTVRGLSNAKLTPEIEARLIEMAQRPAERHDAVYFGLSTAKHKSRRVVDTLFAYLMDDNHSTRGRAHWGLERGVPEHDQPYVARRYAEQLTKFVNPKSHQQALQLIARYGDDSVIPRLEQFADNQMVDPRVRALARKAADHVRTKAASR